MERLSAIRGRIASLTELRDIVGAMRSMAASQLQQARAALPGVRAYAAVIHEALAQALAALPPRAPADDAGAPLRSTAVVVFSSEHGFAGMFNERLIDSAAEALTSPADRLLVVGARGAAAAEERGHRVVWQTAMATHADRVLPVARRVADELYRRLGAGEHGRVVLIHAESAGGATWGVVQKALLPFEPTPDQATSRAPPPLFNLDPEDLLDGLIDELVFAEIMHAAMESFAGENGARLTAMESAHEGIGHKLTELEGSARRLRQEEITTELLDVVTGAEAMSGHSE